MAVEVTIVMRFDNESYIPMEEDLEYATEGVVVSIDWEDV
jgi:hypothetical protein